MTPEEVSEDFNGEIYINGTEYFIDYYNGSWCYSRQGRSEYDLEQDRMGGFETHIDALQAAMGWERDRNGAIGDMERESGYDADEREMAHWRSAYYG